MGNGTETRKVLENIQTRFDTCQRFIALAVRFKLSLPDENELAFGIELSLDLIFLECKAVLQIIDIATRFGGATFLESNGETHGQSGERIWLAFVQILCTVYTGYPNILPSNIPRICIDV